MTPDDLDRILAAEEPLVPSSGFAAAVMEQVHEVASTPPPLPFPWRRFLPALFSVSMLAGLCGWLMGQPLAREMGTSLTALSAALASPRVPVALSEAATALGGAYALARLMFLLSSGRR